MLPKLRIKVGLVLVVSGILAAWASNYWYTTRIFNPVEMNVSLEADKTQTVEFNINLRETYWVGVLLDYSANDYIEGNCGASRLNSMRWKLFRIGKDPNREQEPWAESEYHDKQHKYSETFRANPGRYELEWRVSPETTCLNSRHPRLSIETSSEDSDEMVQDILYACVVFALLGAGLLMQGFSGLFTGFIERGRPSRIFPELALKNVIPMRRHRPMPLIANLPIFVPLWICTLTILVIMFAAMLMTPLMLRGFLVHFDKPRLTDWEKSPWKETMSVYVDGLREFYVNGRHVEPQNLPERLKAELGKRMVWTVYFEADENARVSDAEYAMNTIQHLGAKLIWLTPRTRKELNQEVPK
jgi:biopolymer transport protein ExbD